MTAHNDVHGKQCYPIGSTGSEKEMAKILDHCMTLVPLIAAEHESVDNIQLHPVLFGGDQLTVARMRGTQALRDTEETPVPSLEGIGHVYWGETHLMMKSNTPSELSTFKCNLATR